MGQWLCPKCRVRISVPASAAGKRARCPRCKSVFVIPSPSAAASGSDNITDGSLRALQELAQALGQPYTEVPGDTSTDRASRGPEGVAFSEDRASPVQMGRGPQRRKYRVVVRPTPVKKEDLAEDPLFGLAAAHLPEDGLHDLFPGAVRWPSECVCCGGPSEAYLAIGRSEGTGYHGGQRVTIGTMVRVPYCKACLRHCHENEFGSGILFTGLGGLFFALGSAFWVRGQLRAPAVA